MAKGKRDVAADLNARVIEDEFIGIPPRRTVGTVAKVALKVAPKVAPKVVSKAAVPKAPTSRGAVVKPAGRLPPPPRTSGVTYRPDAKITVLEGARTYREGGEVKAAVDLMKKHGTVRAYELAMEKTNNSRPAIPLLRYLHKKQAVKVEG